MQSDFLFVFSFFKSKAACLFPLILCICLMDQCPCFCFHNAVEINPLFFLCPAMLLTKPVRSPTLPLATAFNSAPGIPLLSQCVNLHSHCYIPAFCFYLLFWLCDLLSSLPFTISQVCWPPLGFLALLHSLVHLLHIFVVSEFEHKSTLV